MTKIIEKGDYWREYSLIIKIVKPRTSPLPPFKGGIFYSQIIAKNKIHITCILFLLFQSQC